MKQEHIPQHIAKHLREVFFGGNWTASDLSSKLESVSWKQATTEIEGLNSIATLTFHIGYYITAALSVLNGEPLTAKDELSFTYPPINSTEDWESLKTTIFIETKQLIELIEQLPEKQVWEDFTDKKYGTYFRNLIGTLEHTHYHLGQIALIKKLTSET